MKIIFMGTPDFAASALKAMYEAGHEISAVVTQPDKARGRSGGLSFSEVKKYASEKGLRVIQPLRIKDGEVVKELLDIEADIAVVAAFGQILPKALLEGYKYGCVNIHASVLPKFRGASPIQQAILDGEKETGITIMKMDEGMDTGDILHVEKLEIEDGDNAGTLFDKLSELGGKTILKTLLMMENNELSPVKQDDEKASSCSKITKEAGRIDWKKDSLYISRQVRAYTPWPSAYTLLEGRLLKISNAAALDGGDKEGFKNLKPGTVIAAYKEGIDILCGNGRLRIFELQIEGKKSMKAGEFLNGRRLIPGGTLLGS